MVHCIRGRGWGFFEMMTPLIGLLGWRDTDWKRLDRPGWIWTHQGQETLVSHQLILPIKSVCICFNFFLFSFHLFFVCWLSWWGLSDDEWVKWEIKKKQNNFLCKKQTNFEWMMVSVCLKSVWGLQWSVQYCSFFSFSVVNLSVQSCENKPLFALIGW